MRVLYRGFIGAFECVLLKETYMYEKRHTCTKRDIQVRKKMSVLYRAFIIAESRHYLMIFVLLVYLFVLSCLCHWCITEILLSYLYCSFFCLYYSAFLIAESRRLSYYDFMVGLFICVVAPLSLLYRSHSLILF